MKLLNLVQAAICLLMLFPYGGMSQSLTGRHVQPPTYLYGDTDHDHPEVRSRWERIAQAQAASHSTRSSTGMRLYVDSTATGLSDGSSWQDAFTDLQDALAQGVAGDTIWMAAGTYYPSLNDDEMAFVLPNGISLYGGFAGTETSLSERDLTQHVTILSGDIDQNDLSSPLDTLTDMVGSNSVHVLFAVPGPETTYLDGLTVTAGDADGEQEDLYGGGLMSFTNLSPTSNMVSLRFHHCTFQGNRAARGGAIGIRGLDAGLIEVETEACLMKNNSTVDGAGGFSASGGAIELFTSQDLGLMKARYLHTDFVGNTSVSGSPHVHHRSGHAIDSTQVLGCTFSDGIGGSGSAGSGGLGFSVLGQNGLSGLFTIDSCRFTNNRPLDPANNLTFGGGVRVEAFGEALLEVFVSNSHFENNVTFIGGGLMIGLFRSVLSIPPGVSYASVSNCTFINNEARSTNSFTGFSGSFDAAVAGGNRLTLDVSDCVIEDSRANQWGGMGLSAYDRGIINGTLTRCTFRGNAATEDGGGLGLASWPDSDDFTLFQDTATAQLSLRDCLFEDNTARDGAGIAITTYSRGEVGMDATHLTVSDNVASRKAGGIGILKAGPIAGRATVRIDSSQISGNHAEEGGGIGVDALTAGFQLVLNLDLAQLEMHDNAADLGGGLFVENSANAHMAVHVSNLDLQRDTATTNGGGLFVNNSGPGSIAWEGVNLLASGLVSGQNHLHMGASLGSISSRWAHATVVSNQSSSNGYALMPQASGMGQHDFTLFNSLFWDNQGLDLLADGAVGTTGFNLLPDSTGIVIDPQFMDFLGPDSLPGTGDEDYRLSDTSPAINAGLNSEAISMIDLLGEARIQQDTVDIGAYESPYSSPVPVGIDDASAGMVVYPNPARQTIWVDYVQREAGPSSLSLLDALGRTVYQVQHRRGAGNYQERISLVGLSPGLYQLRIQTPSFQSSHPLLIIE